MRNWKLQDAKARLSELVQATERDGPQIITRRGEAVVVVVPFKQWERTARSPYATLKDWLLAPEPRFDLDLPPRRRGGRMRRVKFD